VQILFLPFSLEIMNTAPLLFKVLKKSQEDKKLDILPDSIGSNHEKEKTESIHPFYNQKTAQDKAAAIRRTQSAGCISHMDK
jgi:hypothetical protein